MQEFYINKGNTLPKLRMELINSGRFDFHRANLYNNAIQNADITFSMKDSENGILKVSEMPARAVLEEDAGCEERYVLEYAWKERDTKTPGIYEAWFTIRFHGSDIYEAGQEYPDGILNLPIQEHLLIYVQ